LTPTAPFLKPVLRSLQVEPRLVQCRLRGELLPCQGFLALVLKLVEGNLVFGLLNLSLGILHQSPDRHSRIFGDDGILTGSDKTSWKTRLVRLRYIELGDRRIAAPARSRRGARLVRLQGNPH